MPIIYVTGIINVPIYEKICLEHGATLNPNKVVFIFPGNAGHHRAGTTLFSIKSGGGLATASRTIGQNGYPTLSLPTTNMEDWRSSKQTKTIVLGAIADLYKAVGAGYNLMLPVREHKNKNFFDTHLQHCNGQLEPSFWGGLDPTPNKELAKHYCIELNNLAAFINLSSEEKEKLALTDESNPFYAAYLNGLHMQKDNLWLKQTVTSPNLPNTIIPVELAPAAEPTNTQNPTPAFPAPEDEDKIDKLTPIEIQPPPEDNLPPPMINYSFYLKCLAGLGMVTGGLMLIAGLIWLQPIVAAIGGALIVGSLAASYGLFATKPTMNKGPITVILNTETPITKG